MACGLQGKPICAYSLRTIAEDYDADGDDDIDARDRALIAEKAKNRWSRLKVIETLTLSLKKDKKKKHGLFGVLSALNPFSEKDVKEIDADADDAVRQKKATRLCGGYLPPPMKGMLNPFSEKDVKEIDADADDAVRQKKATRLCGGYLPPPLKGISIDDVIVFDTNVRTSCPSLHWPRAHTGRRISLRVPAGRPGHRVRRAALLVRGARELLVPHP